MHELCRSEFSVLVLLFAAAHSFIFARAEGAQVGTANIAYKGETIAEVRFIHVCPSCAALVVPACASFVQKGWFLGTPPTRCRFRLVLPPPISSALHPLG
ncbi:hypothetical protein AVEN_182557-1 [Araneus ventricosus]|uniref:Secreted protein n=1 Tax=Araneus ventricosus TaxID=182803 RepID=A0A4Y2U0Z1_ARAVE|nr:hypothetical protein AVEN_182557-1 [Araneus ventricosus]